jgi:acyl carrier protein
MSIQISQRVAKILSLALQKNVQADDQLALGKPAEWDSLKQIEILLLIEEEFGVQVPPEKIPELTSQKQISQFLIENPA